MFRHAWFPIALAGTIAFTSPVWAAPPDHHAPGHAPAIPASLKAEHHALHERLSEATRAGGRTGEAAKALEAVMMPHFREEERIAMPPLSLLEPLARGEKPHNAQAIITMTDELRRAWPKMLREHAQIAARLKALRAAAVAEKKPAVVAFADALALHAKQEEEIYYPAALLVGDRLRAEAAHEDH
jgi:hypothetical protein